MFYRNSSVEYLLGAEMNPGQIISVCRNANLSGAKCPPVVLRSLSVGVCGSLPKEYELMMEKVGRVDLGDISFYHPAEILAYTASIYNVEGRDPHQWVALPIAKYQDHGDDIGYIRRGRDFETRPVLLDHEGPWSFEFRENWFQPLAESLAELLTRHTEA